MAPKLGDRAWQVEWTTHVPLDEMGDAIPTRAETETALFSQREQAMLFAENVLPSDFFGAVRVTLVELSDTRRCRRRSAYTWEAVEESEFVS
jgi:hypothetical protein